MVSQKLLLLTGIVVIIVSITGVLFYYNQSSIVPNSHISEATAQSGEYANVNPDFRVEFGDGDNSDSPVVRFEATPVSDNPF